MVFFFSDLCLFLELFSARDGGWRLIALTNETRFEQIILVKISPVHHFHLLAHSLGPGAQVILEGLEGEGKGVNSVNHELDLGVLLVCRVASERRVLK